MSEYPSDWKLIPIREIITESRINPELDDPSKRISVRLHCEGVEKRSERATDQAGATRYYKRLAGQFIYGKQNLHKGAVGIVPEELDGFCSSQDIPAFDITPTVDPNWFLHLFRQRNFYESLENIATGTGSKRIQPSELGEKEIAVPPLPEQKKITEILSGIDFLLKALNDLIAKQVSLKKAMTWDLMSHGAGSRDLKDSDQGKIPFDWEVRSLGSVFTLTSGKSKPKSLLSSIATGSEKIPVYGGNGITGYASEYLLDLPTITIGRVGEYCGAVHLTPNMCWVTDNALYIKDRISDFDLPFMYYFLVFCEISKMRKKGGQPLISQKPILDLVVALPPIEEQRRIALTLNSISKNISIMEVRRQRIKEFRDSVSQDLLSGRKRVSI